MATHESPGAPTAFEKWESDNRWDHAQRMAELRENQGGNAVTHACENCGRTPEEAEAAVLERGAAEHCRICCPPMKPKPYEPAWIHGVPGSVLVDVSKYGKPRVQLSIHVQGGMCVLSLTPAESTALLCAVAAAEIEAQRQLDAQRRSERDAQAGAQPAEEGLSF